MPSKTVPSRLTIKLLSDTTFGRGEGTAGLVDVDVEHDTLGLPFIGGRTVHGLLRDSWLSMHCCFPSLSAAADRVLGRSKSLDEGCRLRVGDALLPDLVRKVASAALERQNYRLRPDTILTAFSEIRYQTAEDRSRGAPEKATLRSSRVVLRGFTFEAALIWLDGYQPCVEDLQVLALCALATRHGGLARNRGRGHLMCTLDGNLERTRTIVEGFSGGRAS